MQNIIKNYIILLNWIIIIITMKNIKNNNWFTMVELVIAIWILLVLLIISVISLSNYTKISRNSARLADIQSIKKTLEVYILHSWKYPLPDRIIEVTYSWELVWNQWFFWEKVFANSSQTLNKIPIDPFLWSEYIYSVENKQREYQIMTVEEEWNTAQINNKFNIFQNEVFASSSPMRLKIKLEWNYNWLFVQTKRFLIPTPSIVANFSSVDISSWKVDLGKNPTLLNSIVYTWEKNIPNISSPKLKPVWWQVNMNLVVWNAVNKESDVEEKVEAFNTIQEAYKWTTFENKDMYSSIISSESFEKKKEYSEFLFWIDYTWENIESLSCIINWRVVGNNESITLYKEEYIEQYETYDCESVSQDRVCEKRELTWWEEYEYLNCIKWEPDPCQSQLYTINWHNYSLPTISHWESLKDNWIEYLISQQITEDNWIYLYKLQDTLWCNDGTFINFTETERELLVCKEWYEEVWEECVFSWEFEITSWDTLICPWCN